MNRLPEVQAFLAKNADASRMQTCRAIQIGKNTLRAMEKAGFIKFNDNAILARRKATHKRIVGRLA